MSEDKDWFTRQAARTAEDIKQLPAWLRSRRKEVPKMTSNDIRELAKRWGDHCPADSYFEHPNGTYDVELCQEAMEGYAHELLSHIVAQLRPSLVALKEMVSQDREKVQEIRESLERSLDYRYKE